MLNFRGAKIGGNPFIDVGVIINSPKNLVVGDNVVISCYTVLTAGGSIKIEDDVMIGYKCNLLSQNHAIPKDVSKSIRFSGHTSHPIHIKKGAWLASNVTILPGVTVGEGAVIGAGAVVTKDVEDYSIYAGVPAKKIKDRIEESYR
ncbi:acyltransferase [Enterococcus alcedinis]